MADKYKFNYKELWGRLKQVLSDRIKIYRDDQKNLIARKNMTGSLEARNRALATEQVLTDMKELEKE